MAYAEKRGSLWRARWRGPDSTLESKPGFRTRKEAEKYGRDQEAAIRSNTYVDPRAGRITLTEWVNQWYPALDLEPTTLSNYRYRVEVLILPAFGNRALNDLSTEEIATWEIELVRRGYARRTARDARSMLITVLGDAVPRYIQSNPAERRRGKGRKGQRRIARLESAEKVWATPFQVLLTAERCAALSGQDTDFVMNIFMAYTGARWSEVIGLTPECVHGDQVGIDWKLYELNGRFYKGRPKDGSIRPADLPPFLAQLLADYLASTPDLSCTCRGTEEPWCPGGEYVFLGPGRGHFRRSNYSERFFRPAADGWYLAREGKHRPRPAVPVLVTGCEVFPGQPVPPWPPAAPGQEFVPPTGRGFPRYVGDEHTGRCQACGRAWQRRLDGRLTSHMARGSRCPGSAQESGPDVILASWLPVLRGLTPHGLRHGHQTWMDEDGIPEVLKTERMGHEVPGMHGVYGHVSPAMRADLKAALQERWEAALRERTRINPRSIVPALDTLLAAQVPSSDKIRSHLAPRQRGKDGRQAVQSHSPAAGSRQEQPR
jgi:integrase